MATTNHLQEKRIALFNERVERLKMAEGHDLYDAIEDLTPFTRLNLSSKHMGCREAQVLSSAIIDKRNVTNGKIVVSITDLDLSRNNIGDDGALALSRSLTTNSTITELNLCWNRIADSGAAEIGTVLGPAQRIDDLNLSHNMIADAGCAALCKAMLTNLTLTLINLSFNKIGRGGAASLGRMLQQNQRLISVDLANNSIGDAGITELAGALTVNGTLETLNLENNDIHFGPAAPALAGALVANENLKVLKLAHNWLGDEGAAILALGLQTNKTIEVLDLSFNRVIEPDRYRDPRIEI